MKNNKTVIIGKKFVTIFNKDAYAAFYNIPYADVPVGDLRFKPPKEKSDLLGQQIHDYSEYYSDSVFDLEDCLRLSVYVPMINTTDKYPVLVWITNNKIDFGPDFFIEERIVVVKVRYRTSIFGFLNTGDDFAEGNMGAKDVIAALKWIQKNISYFKGDKHKITVLGHSNSAVLVSALLVSPIAKDLFSRAIVLDGSVLCPENYRFHNFEILNKLYCKMKGRFDKFDRGELYEKLKSMSASELVVLARNLYDSSEVRNNQRPIKSFTLSRETSRNAFLRNSPIDLYCDKKINKLKVIFGYTNLRSLYRLQRFSKNRNLLKYLKYNFQYMLPFEGTTDEFESKRYRKIQNNITEFYFLNGTITDRSLRRYTKYLSDRVIYSVYRQAMEHEGSYLCRFSFKGSLNFGWDLSTPELKWKGATLGDEICYLFRCKFADEAYTNDGTNERRFIKKIVKLFANFVRYGDPTPEKEDDVLGNIKWMPMDTGCQALQLSRHIKMINVPELKRLKFWDDLKRDFFDKI
ncbi:venom carboxylesterase-6-like [Aricia agestis]|uniref:venom carboxylesterase-6-like n=1 Tax=Aricia agestis TaxID=91739 RepID=UPI001C203097|nr:venom carboxylesterase-6-like [Aricia agestis]